MTRAGLELIRSELQKTADEACSRGMPSVEIRGQLIRPAIAYAVAMCGDRALAPGFWKGALAIQLAHEASLVHDDIIDTASTRRGEPTVAARHGVAKALVYGDHLLTAAYRLAAETGSIHFALLLSQGIERTVAGEIAQARSLGRALSWPEYREIAEGKAGELLGCALALTAALDAPHLVASHTRIGKRLGLLYQMLDDLLDYCVATNTGKSALGDFQQKRWTWPLSELGDFSFDEDATAIAARLRSGGTNSPLRRCLARIEAEARGVRDDLSALTGAESIATALVDDWLSRARIAVDAEERSNSSALRVHAVLRARIPDTEEMVGYLAANSKSFRFAGRFFPAADLRMVADVYGYCRITDDLVDRPGAEDVSELLEEWVSLSRRAYHGDATGIPFLDRVMGEMATRSVPFEYAADLAEGMRMDLRGQRYANLDELRAYTYRVASVVGLWLTELYGVRDRRVLTSAAALGHAMQLTNILRDVGEDARNGRLYLPADYMARHGITIAMLLDGGMSRGRISHSYHDMVEELLQVAEDDYELAFKAIPELPAGFRKPVAVAAHVYRGIHAEIRRRAYDNLTQRAVTSLGSKAILATRALWDLRAVSSVKLARTA